MRTLQRFATVCFIGAAFAALVSACGSTDAAPPVGGAGAGTAGAPAITAGAAGAATAGAPAAGGGAQLTGDVTRGAALYKSTTLICNSCHGENAEGMSGPNITGNMTAGIGSWTEQQFHDVVRNAKNRQGADLCIFMPPVPATSADEQGIADLYAFTKSKDSAVAVTGSYCAPGMCLGKSCTGGV